MDFFEAWLVLKVSLENLMLFRTHLMCTSQGWMHLAHKTLTQWRLFITVVHLRMQLSLR